MAPKNVWTLKSSIDSALSRHNVGVNPVEWVEDNFGVSLYSNQISNIQSLFDTNNNGFSVIECRGAGKTWSVAIGIASYCVLYPGLRVILVGPKDAQANRIIREIYDVLNSNKCKIKDDIDWSQSSAKRIQFLRGSYIVALSGQETANVEGWHGHILVIDEAHLVPTYSVTNKLTPMVGMLEFSKIVKIGVAQGKNHFYTSCSTPGAVVNKCTWQDAEIFLDHGQTFWYKNRQYSKALVDRMPVPYKEKYFNDRPDLKKRTGHEVSILDWETQYELIWADDLLNFLSDDDQQRLASGTHNVLTKALPGETYFAGLDTAQGSITGRLNTDETVLSIYRRQANGMKEKVATFIWKGSPLSQMEEIWHIIHPTDGLFPVALTLVDYSNIGIAIVEQFQNRKVPIIGKHFQATEVESRRNWKNAMYDWYLVQLQTGMIKYPNIKNLETQKISATGDVLNQIENTLRSFWEWCTLQRIRGRGLNDRIQAPEDGIEDENGQKGRSFDDCPTADIMAVWACDKSDVLITEMSKRGDLSAYAIPFGVVGPSATAMVGVGGGNPSPTATMNPVAREQIGASQERPVAREGTTGVGGASLNNQSYLSNLLNNGSRLFRK